MKITEAKELDKICDFLMSCGKGPVKYSEIISSLKLKKEDSIELLMYKYRIVPINKDYSFEGEKAVYLNSEALSKLQTWENNKFADKVRNKKNYSLTIWMLIITVVILILTLIGLIK